ncbi:DgyrCDS5762 [Dimorphilus gyrociliatus]|uniref:DgyrCDS5762 n=1 Tax=Dimorphilus gyrociliatus TaxID=2664684 RepID=A0A7I8VKW1_9ANNE|nr:DgyrCDS5762 [Dimorphilus gyrociliatus]
MNENRISYILVFIYVFSYVICDGELGSGSERFKIEGKIFVPFVNDLEWISSTKIIIDGGRYLGFLKSDGAFSVSNLPSGSYSIEVINPSYVFEPARIDITSKGKFRARKMNNIQLNAVSTINYPLKLKARSRINYFQEREKWSITDMIFSPMVLMMVLPLIMVMVLPKLINAQDPETQREMQSQMNFLTPKNNIPEFSEFLTNLLSGGPKKPSQSRTKPSKRR